MPQRPRLGTRESGTRDSFAQSEPRPPDGEPAASQGPSGGGALEVGEGEGAPKGGGCREGGECGGVGVLFACRGMKGRINVARM